MATAEKIGCITAATAILGDKWTPQLLRHLGSSDSLRFCQLQKMAGGINPRTLSARLTTLENNAIIIKVANDSPHYRYTLTTKGRELLPILQSMEQWSQMYGTD